MSEFVTLCPRCEAPLIFTFVFSHKELYCLECGYAAGLFGGGVRVDATVELVARLEALTAEFGEIAESLITPFSRRRDCERCESGSAGDHHEHATDEEKTADREARERLVARRTAVIA